MTPNKSKTLDAAQKLMLDLVEKHPAHPKLRCSRYSKTSQGKAPRCCESSLAIL
jgi:hypothetical protein